MGKDTLLWMRQSQSSNLTALAQPVNTTAQQRQQPANTTALQGATCDWTNTIVATTTVDDNTNSLYTATTTTATTTTITITIQYFATTTSSWPGYTAATTNLSAITIRSTTATVVYLSAAYSTGSADHSAATRTTIDSD